MRLDGVLIERTAGEARGDRPVVEPNQSMLTVDASFAAGSRPLGMSDRAVPVSLIPYCVRLNHAGDWFRVWLPVD